MALLASAPERPPALVCGRCSGHGSRLQRQAHGDARRRACFCFVVAVGCHSRRPCPCRLDHGRNIPGRGLLMDRDRIRDALSTADRSRLAHPTEHLARDARLQRPQIGSPARAPPAGVDGGAGPLRLFSAGPLQYWTLIGIALLATCLLALLALVLTLSHDGMPALRAAFARPPGRFAAGILVWFLTGLIAFSAMERLQPRYLEAFAPAMCAMLGLSVGILGEAVSVATVFREMSSGGAGPRGTPSKERASADCASRRIGLSRGRSPGGLPQQGRLHRGPCTHRLPLD